MWGNASPTAKFPSQFVIVAMVTATGLASCRNSSATISHGMAPEGGREGEEGGEGGERGEGEEGGEGGREGRG